MRQTKYPLAVSINLRLGFDFWAVQWRGFPHQASIVRDQDHLISYLKDNTTFFYNDICRVDKKSQIKCKWEQIEVSRESKKELIVLQEQNI